jgi:putative transposase
MVKIMNNPEVTLKRKTIRLKEYDYSQSDYYFITICAKDKKCLFGNIVDINGNGHDNASPCSHKCVLSRIGKIVDECWNNIPLHCSHVSLGEYVIMPNHIHGILVIDYDKKKALNYNRYQHVISGSISSIVRGFKIGVTKWYRSNINNDEIWQRSFYEHVIRNDKAYAAISEYIIHNPDSWGNDELFVK